MSQFANFSELYNAGGSFDKQEVIQATGLTTIYGGYAPSASPEPETETRGGWLIRRLVVVETSTTQTITCTWARGSWENRAALDYHYQRPER